ncbi:hypothetical protein SDC9_177269 [bioreactor metagenome]|uniref:Uncharacterized protein n=1 Tax=bioreactor metagenome TaxID=1076179 RepID=A0A645GU90_9ZZZZ
MEKRGRQYRVGAAARQGVVKMRISAGAAGGDDGDVHRSADKLRQLEVIARLCAVAVHARQQYLASAEPLGLNSPAEGVHVLGASSSRRIDLPVAVAFAFRVYRDNHALAAKNFGRLADEGGIFYRR